MARGPAADSGQYLPELDGAVTIDIDRLDEARRIGLSGFGATALHDLENLHTGRQMAHERLVDENEAHRRGVFFEGDAIETRRWARALASFSRAFEEQTARGREQQLEEQSQPREKAVVYLAGIWWRERARASTTVSNQL